MIFFDHFGFFRKLKAGIKQNTFDWFFILRGYFPLKKYPLFYKMDRICLF